MLTGEAGTVHPEVELVLAVAIMGEEQRVFPRRRHLDTQRNRPRLRGRHANPAEELAFLDQIAIVLQEIGLGRGVEFELQLARTILQAGDVGANRGARAAQARRAVAAEHAGVGLARHGQYRCGAQGSACKQLMRRRHSWSSASRAG
jgi:hypothetical protein